MVNSTWSYHHCTHGLRTLRLTLPVLLSSATAAGVLYLCVMSQTELPQDTVSKHSPSKLKSIFLSSSATSRYDQGAPRPGHGAEGAHFHCYQQGGPLYSCHRGAYCKAAGTCLEATGLQQGAHGHRQ